MKLRQKRRKTLQKSGREDSKIFLILRRTLFVWNVIASFLYWSMPRKYNFLRWVPSFMNMKAIYGCFILSTLGSCYFKVGNWEFVAHLRKWCKFIDHTKVNCVCLLSESFQIFHTTERKPWYYEKLYWRYEGKKTIFTLVSQIGKCLNPVLNPVMLTNRWFTYVYETIVPNNLIENVLVGAFLFWSCH